MDNEASSDRVGGEKLKGYMPIIYRPLSWNSFMAATLNKGTLRRLLYIPMEHGEVLQVGAYCGAQAEE